MEEQVQKSLFREDLFYRLNVLPVLIPPLRYRKEDIIELAEFFLGNYKKHSGKKTGGFSQGALDALVSYSWPGNVRELQNCIERACVIGRNKLIEPEELFLKTGNLELNNRETPNRNLKTAVNDFKTGFIRMVMEENAWNQTETSKALGIQRTYLSRLIKELKIEQ